MRRTFSVIGPDGLLFTEDVGFVQTLDNLLLVILIFLAECRFILAQR